MASGRKEPHHSPKRLRRGEPMGSWLRCLALAAFVTLILVPPVRAANEPASHPQTALLAVDGTSTHLPSALQPAVTDTSAQLKPVRLVSVPVYPSVASTVLATSIEPIGRISGKCAGA